MRFGPREIVFALLLALLPVGAWWFIYRPQNARNHEVCEQIKVKQEKLRTLHKVRGTIGDLQKEIDAGKQALAYFQTKLPNEKEIDKVLQGVWRLAEANHLTTKSIRTLTRVGGGSAQAPASGPREQPVAVLLEGDFAGFYTFLQALENQPRIMRIQRLSLETDEKENNGAIKASFEMSVFFEQEGKGTKCPEKV